MSRRTTSLLVALALSTTLSACGGSGESQFQTGAASDPTTGAPVGPQVPSAAPSRDCVAGAATAPAPAGATKDLTVRPVITAPTAKAPCGLQVADIVVGAGAAAKAGDALKVKYAGVLYDAAQPFDASWDRGADETFDFQLGAGMVIEGWDVGLVGMKVGGRRQLTIPSAQGYGEQGSPPKIPGGATLVFVVDLVKVGA